MKFPTLSSGSVSQYPTTKETRFRNQRIRFLDGAEQCLRQHRKATRSWVVRLEALTDVEIAVLEDFLRRHGGRHEVFEFTDPFDGTTYPSCHLAHDEGALEWLDHEKGRALVWIHEVGG